VPDATDLLVVGSVALDSREGPFGSLKDELGGSAVYFALAASLLTPVTVSAPVGNDAIDKVAKAFDGRPIDTTSVRLDSRTTLLASLSPRIHALALQLLGTRVA